ncbi:MAG: glycoside hydrolase family 2 TIM barrel-domain containing protein [Ignavibacteriaceae bacterium]|jgi:beta-galactosidase
MGLPKNIFFTILLLISFLAKSSSGQIIFKELPDYQIKSSDSSFFDIGSTRSIIPLDGTWEVYSPNSKEDEKVSVSIPSIFQGDGELIFDKYFNLSKSDIQNHKMKLVFLGLNYTADISMNGVIIFRHSGGEVPFQFDLPKDILRSDGRNVLSVRLYYRLDSGETIPLKQRFLFPQNFGGIIRDVYIQLLPNVSISDLNLLSNYESGTNRSRVSIFSKIYNNEFSKSSDTLTSQNQFVLRVKFISPNGGSVTSTADYLFQLIPNRERDIFQTIDLISPTLWSPSSPQSYTVYFELWNGGMLIDRTKRSLAIFSLKSGTNFIFLNGQPFTLNGVTYVPSSPEYGNMLGYDLMEKDIRMIKELGFNCVKFSKSIPNPYYLSLCEKYGLVAFIELPLVSIPEQLAQDQNFINRCRNYLFNFITAYQRYSAVGAIGLGDSYLTKSDAHISLIKNLAGIIKSNTNKLVYTSFNGFNISPIDNVDLYGVEIFNSPVNSFSDKLKQLQSNLGTGKVFISGATYIVNIGNTNGYVNDHSFEAQAKFFEDLIEFAGNNPLAGYFINTMFDYRGDYASLSAGYNKDNVYQIGICNEERGTDRLGFKVIYSLFHNTEKVTIPIGSKKDDAPIVFILYGLLLALGIGILVNSGRKFREDSSRALLRPYNFFSDVRDQRIMSGYHTTVLALIVSAVTSLIVCNLLFYFKESVVFEKLLLSFGSTKIIKDVSYLAWHPAGALILFTALCLVAICVITLIVKTASFFVRNRVFYSSVYFSVIWSLLPFILLIPAGIVLYRLLSADIVNLYIYIGLSAFAIWVFYRLMKGIYVIFDVNPGSVYFYSIIFILVILGGILLYYQIKNSVVDYLQLTIKQYNLFR